MIHKYIIIRQKLHKDMAIKILLMTYADILFKNAVKYDIPYIMKSAIPYMKIMPTPSSVEMLIINKNWEITAKIIEAFKFNYINDNLSSKLDLDYNPIFEKLIPKDRYMSFAMLVLKNQNMSIIKRFGKEDKHMYTKILHLHIGEAIREKNIKKINFIVDCVLYFKHYNNNDFVNEMKKINNYDIYLCLKPAILKMSPININKFIKSIVSKKNTDIYNDIME